MKEKEGVKVIYKELSDNPFCSHGPTILFSTKNGKQFFGCSAIRNEQCFKLDFDVFEKNKEKILREPVKCITKYHEKVVLNQFYCLNCQKVVNPVDHKNHKTITIDQNHLAQPSLFLTQLDNDKFNAQYFFDDKTLKFFTAIFRQLKLKKIISIGSPRLHDYIRTQNFDSLLLDIDDRFQPYYPEKFCHFNIFNYHFFDGADGKNKLKEFLKDDHADERSSHCIFIDPPFAGRTELLSLTLKEISLLYTQINQKLLPIFWIFPYFNEAHIVKEMPEMTMLDYQVTYNNHSAFNKDYKGRKEGSPVRIFTNINESLKYPNFVHDQYKFCIDCHRYVANNNVHCKICEICPSKNGSEYFINLLGNKNIIFNIILGKYRHCDKCIKCVKPNYSHCDDCGRCVQKLNHDCKAYQIHQECWGCEQFGHVENYCKNLKKFKQKVGKCRVCALKHNLKKCQRKFSFI